MRPVRGPIARVITTEAEIDAAIKLDRAYRRRGAKIAGARYLPAYDVVEVELSTGARIELPRKALPPLRAVPARGLSRAKIGPAGASVWFEPADTGVDLEEIILGAVGADALKAAGAWAMGSVSTSKKAAAARSNGKRGGRPRKQSVRG
jgi:hypothetical protein